MNYPIVSVIDGQWIRLQGEYALELAKGVKRRVRWYLENCLGIPWQRIIFDREYFAEKMRQARKRQQEALERERCMVPNRGGLRTITSDIGEDDFGLIDELFEDEGIGMSKEMLLAFYSRPEYDYEMHKEAILSNVGYEDKKFNDLPQVVQDRKMNRVFNFVTVIFLLHHQLIKVRQAPPDMDIWVRRC